MNKGNFKTTDNFKEDKGQLNLQKNGTENITNEAHMRTMHGGAILAMAAIKEKYWIPKL